MADFNRSGSDWMYVKTYIDKRIKVLQEQMEFLHQPDVESRDTAVRIAELRALVNGIEAPEKPPQAPPIVTY